MAAEVGVPALALFTRNGCHLCEDMQADLEALFPRLAYQLHDVDSDPAWAHRYGTDVPVLLGGEQELCRHFLNPAAVRAYLAGFR